MLFPPTYTLHNLILRFAEETDQVSNDVAGAICDAILSGALAISGIFQISPYPQERIADLPASALGHLKDVMHGQANHLMRFDFQHMLIERGAFKSWLVTNGTALPRFWFGDNDTPAQRINENQGKRQYDKKRTKDRNEAIKKRADGIRQDSKQQKKPIDTVEIAQLLRREPEYTHLSANTIRRILSSK